MTEEVSPQIVKETQTALGKYFKDPPLPDKLLRKPPFRFLQDIVKSVVKETGFLRSVYTDEELSTPIKDKDKKLAFLKKLISSVQDATGSTIGARPSKIVAGLEVTKTLQLLLSIASGIALKSSRAGEQLEEKKSDGHKEPSSSKKVKSKKDGSAKKENKAGDATKVGKTDKSDEGKRKEKVLKEAEKPREKSSKQKIKIQAASVEIPTGEPIVSQISTPVVEKVAEVVVAASRDDNNKENADEVRVNEEEAPEPKTAAPPTKILEEAKGNAELQYGSRKSSADDVAKDKVDKENRETRERPDKRDQSDKKASSARSTSKARPPSKMSERTEKSARPKKPAKEEPVVLGSSENAAAPQSVIERPQTARRPPPSARPQSSRPGVPKARDRGEAKVEIEPTNEVKAVPLITDADHPQDDENTVTVERGAMTPELDMQGASFLDAANKVGENEGALVAQILETQKELEETGQLIGLETNQRNVEIEWEGRQKQRKEAWGKEISKLRDGIQLLTRSTNPLGKLFDFLQEDVDSMQRELKTWRETNDSYTKRLELERRMSENSLETYRRQLAELDSLIEQETDVLRNMKANVLANDRKIYSLLTKSSVE